MHLLQSVSSALRCASKQIPHPHSLRFSSNLGATRWESKGGKIWHHCVWAAAWMEMWRGVQGISKTSQKHTAHSKILIQQPKACNVWSSECRLTQGPVVRRRFPIASEEFQRERKRAESSLKYSDICFLAITILLLTFYLGWLLVPCFGF